MKKTLLLALMTAFIGIGAYACPMGDCKCKNGCEGKKEFQIVKCDCKTKKQECKCSSKKENKTLCKCDSK